MGVHELDQIRWLTGSDLRDSACVAAAGPVQGDVDCATVTLELERGGVAVVSLGRYFPQGDVVWLELMGTRDHARVEILWGEGKTWHAALRAQAEDFARCVSTGEPSQGATAADARRTLAARGQRAGAHSIQRQGGFRGSLRVPIRAAQPRPPVAQGLTSVRTLVENRASGEAEIDCATDFNPGWMSVRRTCTWARVRRRTPPGQSGTTRQPGTTGQSGTTGIKEITRAIRTARTPTASTTMDRAVPHPPAPDAARAKRVRLSDVARRANVSTSTASRALNGIGELSDETRAAVLRAAEELDFRPSPVGALAAHAPLAHGRAWSSRRSRTRSTRRSRPAPRRCSRNRATG